MTKIIQNFDALSVLNEAAQTLALGGLVAFPTETVYGLGANALDNEAVSRIFVAKGRPQDNPLIVHVSNFDMLNSVVSEVPEEAKRLIDAFWPGPLTIILKKSERVSEKVTAGLDTVAVRMPAHPMALYLIEQAGVPVAAPSANLSGSPSTTRVEHVIHDLSGRVDYIIDGGPCAVGLESTVLDVTGKEPQILRPGGVSPEEIEKVLGKVSFDPALKDATKTPKSPGMKYRHYAPKAELYLVTGNMKEKIENEMSSLHNEGKKVGIFCMKNYGIEADSVLFGGEDMNEYAKNLFHSLRTLDEAADVIFAELPAETGGIMPALINRMMKAAGGHVL